MFDRPRVQISCRAMLWGLLFSAILWAAIWYAVRLIIQPAIAFVALLLEVARGGL